MYEWKKYLRKIQIILAKSAYLIAIVSTRTACYDPFFELEQPLELKCLKNVKFK